MLPGQDERYFILISWRGGRFRLLLMTKFAVLWQASKTTNRLCAQDSVQDTRTWIIHTMRVALG